VSSCSCTLLSRPSFTCRACIKAEDSRCLASSASSCDGRLLLVDGWIDCWCCCYWLIVVVG
jgi:hypothetical protein